MIAALMDDVENDRLTSVRLIWLATARALPVHAPR